MGWGWGGSKNGNGLEGWIRKWSQHCQSFTSPLHHLLGPQWQRLLRPGSTHLPLPSFSCIYVLKILITSKLWTYLPLWHWVETAKNKQTKKKNITIMAETEGPWRIVGTVQAWGKLLFPWQQWSPLSHRPHPRPRAPLHLNSHCAKLFCSDFHLPPLLPHPLTVLSPHPAPTPHTHLPHHRPCPPTFRPDPQTGTKTGSKMREPHPPTRCSQCPTLSYVTKDESEMPVIGWCTSSGDICIMAFIMMFYGSDNSVNTARPNPGCHLCGLSLKLVSVFI